MLLASSSRITMILESLSPPSISLRAPRTFRAENAVQALSVRGLF
jgi:hypothetical protein